MLEVIGPNYFFLNWVDFDLPCRPIPKNEKGKKITSTVRKLGVLKPNYRIFKSKIWGC